MTSQLLDYGVLGVLAVILLMVIRELWTRNGEKQDELLAYLKEMVTRQDKALVRIEEQFLDALNEIKASHRELKETVSTIVQIVLLGDRRSGTDRREDHDEPPEVPQEETVDERRIRDHRSTRRRG